MSDSRKEPTYCSVEEIEETLDLPSPIDDMDCLRFSDTTHPKIDQVKRMMLSNEDQIDRRLKHSWRVNTVRDKVYSIDIWEHDENGARIGYWSRGGNMIQLREDILPFDPSMGDKIEIRNRRGQWKDISMPDPGQDWDAVQEEDNPVDGAWPRYRFDYQEGRLYIRIRAFTPYYNALRITYRYGDMSPVPDAVNRLCCLMTATNILNMQAFNIKMGSGGDISGIRDSLIKTWQEEMNMIWGSFQRINRVRGLF